MSHILDRMIPSEAKFFRPSTPTEFVALRLAQKLGNAAEARHYLHLLEQHSLHRLLIAYQRAIAREIDDPKIHFHSELDRLNGTSYGSNPSIQGLISIRVEGRSVAATIFHGEYLEYAQARQLSSSFAKAESSAVGFINWLLETMPVQSAALEIIPNGHEFKRSILNSAISRAIRDGGLSLWEVSKQDLLAAYGDPALSSRKELREIVSQLWPVLNGGNSRIWIQDAIALGLYVQAERLFINHAHP